MEKRLIVTNVETKKIVLDVVADFDGYDPWNDVDVPSLLTGEALTTWLNADEEDQLYVDPIGTCKRVGSFSYHFKKPYSDES